MTTKTNTPYIISACLVGENCKYNGGNNSHPKVKEIFEKGHSIALCPEVLGGFGVPREKTEIQDGGGANVLCGKSVVESETGKDVTLGFIRGAQKAYACADEKGITSAILKARSPSCGCGEIYDGSFSRTLRQGNGVLAQLLLDNGFTVVTEEDV